VTIQKKSLISKLNTTKKAIVASTPATAVSTSEVRTNMARGSSRAAYRATGGTRQSARAAERRADFRR
jgi:hypothetical protein